MVSPGWGTWTRTAPRRCHARKGSLTRVAANGTEWRRDRIPDRRLYFALRNVISLPRSRTLYATAPASWSLHLRARVYVLHSARRSPLAVLARAHGCPGGGRHLPARGTGYREVLHDSASMALTASAAHAMAEAARADPRKRTRLFRGPGPAPEASGEPGARRHRVRRGRPPARLRRERSHPAGMEQCDAGSRDRGLSGRGRPGRRWIPRGSDRRRGPAALRLPLRRDAGEQFPIGSGPRYAPRRDLGHRPGTAPRNRPGGWD